MAVADSSLANLIPYKCGTDPRRNGVRSAGASVIEHYNRLMAQGIDVAELSRIAEHGRTPAERAAAASLARIDKGCLEFAKNGTPLAANDLDRILDRTHGKPTQRVEVERREVKDPAALTVELLRMCAEHPELRAALGVQVAGELVAREVVGEVVEPAGG